MKRTYLRQQLGVGVAMRQLALILRAPQRANQFRMAFASSLGVVTLLVFCEGLLLVYLDADWGYKQLSDPFRKVCVLDFAAGDQDGWGFSLVAAYPRDLADGCRRYVSVQPMRSSIPSPAARSWLVDEARALAAIPGGSQAVLGTANGALYLVDASAAAGRPRSFGRHAQGTVDLLACSQDGRFLLSLSADCLCLWDLPGRQLLWQQTALFTSAAFHPDGRRLWCGFEDGSLVEHDVLTGEKTREVARFESRISRIDVSPDGRHLALICDEHKALLCDAATGATLWWRRPWRGPPRFSPDGDRLASFTYRYGRGWLVALWDARTGQELASLPGHTAMIYGACFTPGGELYSWSADGTLRQWDPLLYREVCSLKVPLPPEPR